MEDLNKNQIVLLTILISFVTSIATGIMTTSLLQEAPIEVTRNINRIVEKTIETVTTPTTVVTTPGQKEVTTVIVKEEDLILDSINKNVKSIVRIEEVDAVNGDKTFYGLGLVVTKEGLMVTDRKTITPNNFYSAVMSDGVKIPLLAMGIDKQTNFILFKANEKLEKDKTPYAFSPAKFSDSDVKLGQTVISVGGVSSNAVAIGRSVSLSMKDMTVGTTTTKYLGGIETDLATKDLYTGSPLFNLAGDVVGMKITGESSKTFVPVSLLRKDINSLSEVSKAQ